MAAIYQIRLKGHVDQDWSVWMTETCVVHEPSGVTVVTGIVPDQPALHGLLRRVRDLGVTLLAVVHVGHSEPEACQVIERRDKR